VSVAEAPAAGVSLLDHFAPWSLSKSDLAAQCTLAFRWKYVDKIKREHESLEAKVGTAAHRVQELLLQGVAPMVALAQTFEEMPNLTSKEQDEVRKLLESLIAFADRVRAFRAAKGATDEYYEQQWAIDKQFKAVDYFSSEAFYRGVVDYGTMLPRNSLVIVDHKSGKEKPLDKHQKQLDSYAVLALAHMPEITAVRAGIHYMKTKKLDWHVSRSREHIQKILNGWLMHLLSSRAALLHSFTPNVSPLCNWCDYKNRCPEGMAFVEEWQAKKLEKARASSKASRDRKKHLPVLEQDDHDYSAEIVPIEGIILHDM